MIGFEASLIHAVTAGLPYVYTETSEERRALAMIESAVYPMPVYTWSAAAGLAEEGKAPLPSTLLPLKVLEFIERHEGPGLFVLLDFHAAFRWQGRSADPQVVRKLRDLAPVLRQSEPAKRVLFLSPVLVLPPELQKEVAILDLPLPEEGDMRTLLEGLIAANPGRVSLDGEGVKRLARAACGLTLQEAEDAFVRAMVERGSLDAGALGSVLGEKRQIVKKGGLLEVVEPECSMAGVGGLARLKRWLELRSRSWGEAAARYGLPAPRGVLITGVPGCGKSLVAKAVSTMWGLPLLRLDMGRVYAGLVGSSEENMRHALRTAEAVAPAILWIDEIEKGVAGRGASTDGGIATRVFGTLLTWMQEKQKPVFVVATANNIDGLPPELLRKGRFDEIFFVDLPGPGERAAIFTLHLERRMADPAVAGALALTPELAGRLAALSDGFSGAEIEQAVIDALFEAFVADRSLCEYDLVRALERTVPLSVTQAEQVQAIRAWAERRAVPAS